MKVFISWSGEPSKTVAEELRQWLKLVIQSLDPWMSSHDIHAGTRWLDELNNKLLEDSFGIICLTAENQTKPWILFEAGALAKTIGGSHVVPYLIDLEPSNIESGPLPQFQAKRANEKETWELMQAINKNLDNSLSDKHLEDTFKMFWPRLDEKLKNLPALDHDEKPKRSSEDMVGEILELVRQMARSASSHESMEVFTLARDFPEEHLENLSEREAFVVNMYMKRRVSIRDIANILGTSESSVYRILKRGQDKMRLSDFIDTGSEST